MKKIFLFCLLFIIPTSLYANTNEENKCFELLNEAVFNDNRFNNETTKEILVE